MRTFLAAAIVLILAIAGCSNERLPIEPYTPTATAVPPTATQIVQPTSYPTYTPYPTAVPTPTQVAAATTGSNTYGAPSTDHWARLEQLDPVFRSQGLENWLKAAGLTWDGSVVEARQPEEETSPQGRISVSGVQLNVKNLKVNWPNLVTTDVPSRITTGSTTIQYKPDARNGSTLYTNVVANGPVTVWVDGSNWGQFTSRLGMGTGSQSTVVAVSTTVAAPTTASAGSTASGCLTMSQLAQLGDIVSQLSDKGQLAGAQLKLKQDLTAAPGWTMQRQGATVTSAKAGETVSYWSPPGCRPLKQS